MNNLHSSPAKQSSSSISAQNREPSRALAAAQAPSKGLIEAFLATRYRVQADSNVCELSIGTPCPELVERTGASNWCILTACNPRASRASDRYNLSATESLKQKLLAMNPRHLYPSVNVNVSDDDDSGGGWPDEPGFLFSWEQRDDVLALARQFGQLGVVCARRGGIPELWLMTRPGFRPLPAHVRVPAA